MDDLYLIAEALYTIYKGDKEKAREWLNTSLPELNMTPYQLIDSGMACYVVPYLMKTYRG